MMEDDAKRRLKATELEAKKTRLRIWTNYVPLAINSKAICDQNFTRKRLLAGTALLWLMTSPYGSSLAERRVNLSSIRCPKIGKPRRDEKPAAYAREAREFLRTRLIGKQVTVEMEYSRKVPMADGAIGVQSSNDRFEVFYLDYGNQDLAFLKVPSLDDELGTEAAQFLSEQTLGSSLQFKAVIEERDTSGGKVKGQGTGTCLVVTLFTEDPEDSINAAMLKYGDVESDDEDLLPPVAAKK
ncbi:hypothetical protein Godav_007017, partial [Gossypium davidsonii]|nr:hypothetical protein [Gossypium davidsonii]